MKIEKAQIAQVFRALGDPHRLQILDLLMEREQNAGELLQQVNVVQSTLSHHMKSLCESGLVCSKKTGKWTYYSVDGAMVELAREFLKKYLPEKTGEQMASERIDQQLEVLRREDTVQRCEKPENAPEEPETKEEPETSRSEDQKEKVGEMNPENMPEACQGEKQKEKPKKKNSGKKSGEKKGAGKKKEKGKKGEKRKGKKSSKKSGNSRRQIENS